MESKVFATKEIENFKQLGDIWCLDKISYRTTVNFATAVQFQGFPSRFEAKPIMQRILKSDAPETGAVINFERKITNDERLVKSCCCDLSA